jgi:hypothetical protein
MPPAASEVPSATQALAPPSKRATRMFEVPFAAISVHATSGVPAVASNAMLGRRD